mmetsp:Transcript_24355/g.28587  ORF Transcript_24355/g.28587 Transcript_24355/m.28587 type:complete len:83 (-) Transcript_24355:83-331(-)|eukprot:CAMPEP_0185572076 /NCGR_PEP_ID=MMETSP0434-20130131/4050_1 /TAXON_ID=626734 ORGANISM="Favella taraikaensis, Strain Fe Narragansett Bay" /NCGR_SAMPLE_ID=MMETSP0434 /ASSEMBLY_ACC=CAM_ASM_000379 /LENGTH=82 /DNA_ID=CAMNT_0028187783 /DNA_START=273 /DNA_END=521 /DNA_ORIENTATION=+
MTYAESARTLSWIVSIYAIGDGLGLYLAKKLYGTVSARTTISLATICSIIACLLYALAGSIAEDEEDMASSVIRQLFTARVL